MPLLDNLTEADIRGALKASSLRRARGYVHRVQEPTRSGRTLTAQVRGTRLYEVEIDVEPTGITARCTCPYNWGGYCKHIGAVLLKWVQSPKSFSVKQPAAASGQDPIPVIPVEPPPSQRPKQPPSWLATPFAGRRQAIKQQLEEWLGAVKLQDLRRMAKRRRWTVKGTRKAAVVQQIMEQIANPGDILRTVLSLDDEHRQVLRALVLLDVGDRIEEDDLQRLVKVWGELKQHKQISTYTRHLAEMGLAVSGDVVSQYPPRGDSIPLAIGQHIPPVLEGIIPIAADQDVSGELYLGDPYSFVRTVNQVVALLVEQKTPVPLRSPMPRPRLEKFHALFRTFFHALNWSALWDLIEFGAVPSLHLRGRLARLVEEMVDGKWRLTPGSIRRAGGSKNKVHDILDELGKLHRGKFPDSLADKIRAWGNYYGNAAVETVTLIEFRDRAALDELRVHPDLKARLTPFPAGNRALAIVPRKEFEEIKEILARFGVRVRDGLRG